MSRDTPTFLVSQSIDILIFKLDSLWVQSCSKIYPKISIVNCLSVSLSVCLSVCLSIRLYVCLSDCLPGCMYVCLIVCQALCLSVCLWFRSLAGSCLISGKCLKFATSSTHLSFHISTCRSLSIYPSIYPYIHLFIFQSISKPNFSLNVCC